MTNEILPTAVDPRDRQSMTDDQDMNITSTASTDAGIDEDESVEVSNVTEDDSMKDAMDNDMDDDSRDSA